MDIRRLAPEDLPACQAIAEEHGWEVGLERWKLLLDVGFGWGAFLPGVGLAGTASLLDYEGRLALVGMVLVRKDQGRRGIGRRVVEEVLAHAPSCTYLYATPMGRGLYEKLGFVATDALLKFAGHPRSDAVSVPEVALLAALKERDFDAVVRFDAAVFGAPRPKLLERLARESVRNLVARRGDAVVGYGFATRVGSHLVLGPVGGGGRGRRRAAPRSTRPSTVAARAARRAGGPAARRRLGPAGRAGRRCADPAHVARGASAPRSTGGTDGHRLARGGLSRTAAQPRRAPRTTAERR